MESEVERCQRLEASRKYSAAKRAQESEEQKAERRLMDRKRAAERRARETEWEREQRLALGRRRAAERRAMESEEDRESRLTQNRERLASKRALKDRSSVEDMVAQLQESRPRPLGDGPGAGAGQAPDLLPVVDNLDVVEMASAGAQQQATVEQPASSGAEGGIEKSGELKQEIVEIKEFRAGTLTRFLNRSVSN